MADEGEFLDKTIDRERSINSVHAAAFLQRWGMGKHMGADDSGRCDYTGKSKYIFLQYVQEIIGKGFIWHVKCCSGVLWEYVNTNSSFTATKGCRSCLAVCRRQLRIGSEHRDGPPKRLSLVVGCVGAAAEDDAMDLESIAILRHDLNVLRGLVLEEALPQLGGNRQVGVGHRLKETTP